MDINDIVVTADVFIDVKKGTHPTEKDLQHIFNTLDKTDICKSIIKNGEVQITAEHRKKMQEEKRKQIIDMIHKNAIDAKTGMPHPTTRIDNAMNEAKVNIDIHKSAETQVQDIIKKLREILPIKYEVREVWVRIPAQFTGRAFSVLKQFGKMLSENWQNNGDLVATVEIPAGLTNDMYDELNKLTHGNVETKIVAKK